MARPKTKKEREAEHRSKNQGKGKNAARVTYITQRDGTQIPVVNYLDNAGKRLNRKDMAEMLEIYSIMGSRGRDMWQASRREVRESASRRREQLKNDSITGQAAQRENMDAYRRGMQGIVTYAERQRGQHQRFMNRERELLQNYMLRLRAQTPLLAERMQRNINLAAMQGGPGGGGGGGGSGGSRGSSSGGSPSGSGAQPQNQDRSGGKRKPGDFEILYPGFEISSTAAAIGIPGPVLDQIASDPALQEFMAQIEKAVVQEGQPPEMAVAEIMPYWQEYPGLDQSALSAASQLVVNHYRIASGDLPIEEVPEFISTDNPMLAIGLDPQAAAEMETAEANQANTLFGDRDFMSQLNNETRSAEERPIQGPEQQDTSSIGNPVEGLGNQISNAFSGAQSWLTDENREPYGSGDLLHDINRYGVGDLAGDVNKGLNWLASDPRPAIDSIGSFLTGSDGGDREAVADPQAQLTSPGPGWTVRYVPGPDGREVPRWVRDSDGAVHQLPVSRLPAPPASVPTPPEYPSSAGITPGHPDFKGSERFGEEAAGQDLWGSLIPGIKNLLGDSASDELDEEQSEQFLAQIASGNAQGALDAVRESIQSGRSREEEKQKAAEEARKRLEEWREKIAAQQRTAAAEQSVGTPSATPGAGWVAPTQPFAIPGAPQPTSPTLTSNGDGTFSDPSFQITLPKPKTPLEQEIDRLVGRFG